MDCRELEFSGPDHDGWLVAPLLLFRSIARSFLRGLNGILAPEGEACVGDEAVARVRVAHGRDVQLVACRQLVVNEAPLSAFANKRLSGRGIAQTLLAPAASLP